MIRCLNLHYQVKSIEHILKNPQKTSLSVLRNNMINYKENET